MLVTDRQATKGRPLIETVKLALEGGVEAVQLRERGLESLSLLTQAESLRVATRREGARLLINDRVDVALAVDADGVQLPQSGFGPRYARRLLGEDRFIGVSTHSMEEALKAEEGGADFILFGPVFSTPSKAEVPPVGLKALSEVAGRLSLPVFAIGGIKEDNLKEVISAGAFGVALITGILLQDDVLEASRRLRDILRGEK